VCVCPIYYKTLESRKMLTGDFETQCRNASTTDPEMVIPRPMKVPPTILEATLNESI